MMCVEAETIDIEVEFCMNLSHIEDLISVGDYANAEKLCDAMAQANPHSLELAGLRYQVLTGQQRWRAAAHVVATTGARTDLTSRQASRWRKRRLQIASIIEERIPKKVIASTDRLFISLVQADTSPSDTLFLAFHGDGAYETSDRMRNASGYAEDFLLRCGYDVVRINKKSYQWYQDLPRDYLHKLLAPFITKYRRVFTYGGSGGGYAALYYSKGIEATCIAYSPRMSLDPACGFKTIVSTEVDVTHEPLSEGISHNKAYIFFDPKYRPDFLYVRRRIEPAFPNLIATRVPFMGHGAHYLAEIGVVKQIVTSIVNDAFVGSTVVPPARRKSSKIYHLNLAKRLSGRTVKRSSFMTLIQRGLNQTPLRESTRADLELYKLGIDELLRAGLYVQAEQLARGYSSRPWFNSPSNVHTFGLAQQKDAIDLQASVINESVPLM